MDVVDRPLDSNPLRDSTLPEPVPSHRPLRLVRWFHHSPRTAWGVFLAHILVFIILRIFTRLYLDAQYHRLSAMRPLNDALFLVNSPSMWRRLRLTNDGLVVICYIASCVAMYAAPTSSDSWGKHESVMAWFGASLFCLLFMFTLKIILAVATLLPEPVGGICDKHGLFGACNELYFSGHVASVMICVWFVCQRWHDRPDWVTLVAVMYAMTVAILALLSRIHYSMDVFGAICLVGALCYMLSLDSPPPNDKDEEDA